MLPGSLLSSLFLCLKYAKCLKRLTNVLLSVVFMTLIIGSIQYASADHSLGGQGIFKDENNVNLASSIDSKWIIHLQVVVRDAQNQLVSVTAATHGSYIPHEISDYIFDEYLSEKEIVNINKIKYQKAQKILAENVQQFPFSKSYHDMQSFWSLEYCMSTENLVGKHGDERGISCIPIFQTITPNVTLGENDTFTLYWTILREF